MKQILIDADLLKRLIWLAGVGLNEYYGTSLELYEKAVEDAKKLLEGAK